ncbi:dockerin type I domain-containing protein [Allorhodopirellula heiligendammensis]|nr:dockerin type I domain-containing protein [Allorhodopirellula heiligendammensis]
MMSNLFGSERPLRTKSSRRRRRIKQRSTLASLFLERLEDRRMLATLDLSGGALSYDGSSATGTLAVELVGTDYQFTDTENITVSGADAASCTGTGTMVVSCAVSAVTSVDIDVAHAATISDLTLTGNLSVAAGNVTLNGPVTSGDTVTLTASDGAITDNNTSDPDIAGTNINLTATTGIGASTDANPTLEINGTNLNAATSGGDIFITDTAGGVALEAVSAGAGLINLTSQNGAITDGNGADVNLTAANGLTLTTTGANNAIGTSSDAIETAIATLTATTNDGDIYIADTAGGVALGAVSAGAGFIGLTAQDGAITDGNGADINLTAANGVSLTATGTNNAIGTTGDAIETATTSLTAATNDGDIYITDTAGGVALGAVTAGAGFIGLTAQNGAITDGNGADVNLTAANGVSLTTTGAHNGIGTADDAIETTTGSLDATTNDGNIYLTDTDGGVALGAVSAGAAFIDLTAQNGAITDGNGADVNLTAANGVSLTTTGSSSAIGTADDAIETAIGALTATTNDGGIYIADSNGPGMIINAVLAKENGHTPYIDGNNQIVLDNNGTQGTDDVSISVQGNVLLNTVTAPDMATITSIAGRVLDINEGSNNVLGQSVSLISNGSIGQDGDAIESSVETFSASTTDGSIFLSSLLVSTAASVVAGGAGNQVLVTSTSPSLQIQTITAQGNVTVQNGGGSLLDDNGTDVNITGSTVSLSGASGIGTEVDPLETHTANLSATVSAPASGITPAAVIFIDNNDGGLVAVSSVAATTNGGDVAINYLGGSLSFVGSTQVLNAAGAAVTFETKTGDVKVGLVDAGSSDISIITPGAITDEGNDADVDVRGGSVRLTAGSGIGGDSNEIETDVVSLEATTSAQGIFISEASAFTVSVSATAGDINVSNTTGDMTLGLVSSPSQVTLHTSGAILDGNGADNNVSADTLNLSAANGIGSSGDALEISVNTLTADGGAGGGLWIANSMALALASAAATGGPVSISASGDLTVSSVTATGQDVTLKASGKLIDGNGTTTNVSAASATLNGSMIGTSSDKIETEVSTLTAATTSGGVFVSDVGTGSLTLTATATGQAADIDIDSAGSIVLTTAIAQGDTVKLDAAGTITNGNAPPPPVKSNIIAKTLEITAPGGIGTPTNPLEADVNQVAVADGGSVGANINFTGPLLLTEAALEAAGSGTLTFNADSIAIENISDDTATIASGRSLLLQTTTGAIVFLDPADTIETTGAGTITIQSGTVVESGAVAVLGNLKTAGGNILATADRTITIGQFDAGAGDVTVESHAGIIVDGNGTAVNVIAGTATLAGAAPTARQAELDEEFAIANAAAFTAQAAAEQTTANALEGQLNIANLYVEDLQVAVANDKVAADSAADAYNRATNTSNGLNVAVATAGTVVSAASVATSAAALVAGPAQAIPLTGDLGAGTILAGLQIGLNVAQVALNVASIAATSYAFTVTDLGNEKSAATAQLLADSSSLNLALASQNSLSEANSISLAAAANSAIVRDASERVRDQAILARDQANVIGSAAEPLGLDVSGVVNVTAGPTDSYLEVTGATAIDQIQTTGSVTLISTGAISDADAGAGADVLATGLNIAAAGGIGATTDPIETRVATLNATNTTSGDIVIANIAGDPAALDITGISNSGGGDVVISNQGSTVGGEGITVSGPVSANDATAAVTINSGSPLTIDSDITAAGAIVLTASDTANSGDDLTVMSGATIESTGSSVTLQAGDNIIVESGSTIQASTEIVITADFDDDPADTTGANVMIAGTLVSPTATIGVGDNADDDDTFTIAPQLATPITVDAGDGSDTLNFNANGLAVTIAGNQITAAGMQPVTFNNFEFVNILNASGGGSITLLAAAGDADTLTLTGTGPQAGTFSLNGGVPIAFTDVDSFYFNANDMADVITVAPFATSVLPWNVGVTIDGGTGDDQIIYNNVVGLIDRTSVTATAPQAGHIDSPGVTSALNSQLVSFTNVEEISANANSGEDEQLTVNQRDTSAADTTTLLDDTAELVGLFNVEMENFVGLTLNGRGGNDTFNITPGTIPVFVNGGNPIGSTAGDLINFLPTSTYMLESGPENDSGGLVPSDAQRVSWDHIEQLSVSGGTGGVFQGTNGDDAITIIARDSSTHTAADGVQDFTVSLNAGPSILFLNTPVFTVNALAGDDDIVLQTLDPAAAVWDVDLTIRGGASSSTTGTGQGGDVFSLESQGTQTVTYSPSVIEVAELSSTINISAVEQVGYEGQGSDTLTINGTGRDDNFVVSLGNGGSGSHRSNAAPSFDYTGASDVTVNGGTGGFDVLSLLGGGGVDTVTSTATVVTIADQGTLTLGSNLSRFELRTFGGNDNITLDLDVPGIQNFVDAGDGNDVIDMAGSQGATIFGGLGDDTITGSDDADLIFGGAGQDVIMAGGGDDEVNGEAGNDIIMGGLGTDRLFGGSDSDVFNWNAGDGSDFVDGGSNASDILNVSGSSAADEFMLQPANDSTHLQVILGAGIVDTQGVQQINVNGLGGGDAFTLTDLTTTEVVKVNLDLGAAGSKDMIGVHGRSVTDDLLVSSTGGVVNVAGLEYDVTVKNAAAADQDLLRLLGNEGNDILTAAAGVQDTILMTLEGGAGDDFLSADATLIGGPGDDHLHGGAGDNQLFGNEGEDTLMGGPGNDTFDGGSGFDTILIQGTSASDSIGVDQSSATTLTVQLNGVNDTDTLIAGTIEQAQVDAGQGDDDIGVRISQDLNATPENSLRVTVHGGEPDASDRLLVIDDGIGNTVQNHQGADEQSGTVIVGPLSPVSYSGIEYVNIAPLDTDSSSSTFGGTGSDSLGRIVVFHPDVFSYNSTFHNPTEFSDLVQYTAKPSIAPGSQADPFGLGSELQADVDWYRFTAPKTGTFEFQLLFDAVPVLANGQAGLPGDGQLRLDVFNADGTPITRLPTETNDATQAIGMEAGLSYLVRIQGATPDSINIYDINVADVDAIGPQIVDPDGAGPQQAIEITGIPTYNLFDVKPVSQGPTPLVNSLTIHIQDGPNRFPGFTYGALDPDISSAAGLYTLTGDHNGIIDISAIVVTNAPVTAGGPATATIELQFDSPLPDDRYTLMLSDSIVDPSGNQLDGESDAQEPQGGPTFPSGDGVPGGDFVARFTVDSRAEIGVYADGSVFIDTNGNRQFDPEAIDSDFTNEDIVYKQGEQNSLTIAGNFVRDADGIADGYDKLATYGSFGGALRWLIDTNNNGVPDLVVTTSPQQNGLPFAGNFDDNSVNGDEVGLKSGTTWHLDTDHDFQVDKTLAGNMTGSPFVGDFDGDGIDDLGAWSNDLFVLNLSSGDVDNIDGYTDVSFTFGFPGVREQPFAADFNGDGLADIGLWQPDGTGVVPEEQGEFYVLMSHTRPLADAPLGGGPASVVTVPDRITATIDGSGGTEISFTPQSFGSDFFAAFGDSDALPVVGNFARPSLSASGIPVDPVSLAVLGTTNLDNPFDVNRDGNVTALDALSIINYLNSEQSTSVGSILIESGSTMLDEGPMFNVNGDGFITALDALHVINHLNELDSQIANPEPVAPVIVPAKTPDLFSDREDERTRELATVIHDVAEGLVKSAEDAQPGGSQLRDSANSSQLRVDDFFANWDRETAADRSAARDSDVSFDVELLATPER